MKKISGNCIWSMPSLGPSCPSIYPHIPSHQPLNRFEPNLKGWFSITLAQRSFIFYPKIPLPCLVINTAFLKIVPGSVFFVFFPYQLTFHEKSCCFFVSRGGMTDTKFRKSPFTRISQVIKVEVILRFVFCICEYGNKKFCSCRVRSLQPSKIFGPREGDFLGSVDSVVLVLLQNVGHIEKSNSPPHHYTKLPYCLKGNLLWSWKLVHINKKRYHSFLKSSHFLFEYGSSNYGLGWGRRSTELNATRIMRFLSSSWRNVGTHVDKVIFYLLLQP